MDFSLTPEQEAIREGVSRVCNGFEAEYWLQKDNDGGFPHDFHQAIARDGWLGVCIPEAYGGAGLGIQEACMVVQAISQSGAGMSGVSG